MSERIVEATIVIKNEAEKVISAFTEFEMLKDWWKVERSLVEKRQGGTYILLWGIKENGIEYVSSGIIDEYNPKAILKVNNFAYICPNRPVLGNMTLEISVKERNDKSKVHLKQIGYQDGKHWDWYYNAVSKVWPEMLNVLKKYLENQNSNR